MSRLPQQSSGNKPKAAQPPNNPPVVLPAPDVAGINETFHQANYVLQAALNQLKTNIQSDLATCQQTLGNTQAAIGCAIKQALTDIWSQASGSYKVVQDNLAYLLSSAQQYAGILGYPGTPIDLSGVPSNVSRTMDTSVGSEPLQIQSGVSLSQGNGLIVPRDVGWQSGNIADPTQPTLPGNVGQRLSSTGQLIDTAVLMPSATLPSVAEPQPVSLVPPLGTGSPVVPVAPNIPPPVTGPLQGQPVQPPATVSPVGTPVVLSMGPTAVSGQAGISLPSGPVSEEGGRITRSIRPGVGSQTGLQGLGTGASGATPTLPATGPSAPLPSGCPTSLIGLPTFEQVSSGNINARLGMWVTDGLCAYRFVTQSEAIQGGNLPGAPYDCQGTECYPVLDPTCPCNQGQQVIPPVEVGPKPPVKPPVQDSCNNLPANQAAWTPWQLANCGTGTIPTACPAPIVACPAPVINVSLADLCGCISTALQTSLPTPVDLDQPLAFKFSADDLPWKRQAIQYSGEWLSQYNESDTDDDYLTWVDKELKVPAAIDDPWE